MAIDTNFEFESKHVTGIFTNYIAKTLPLAFDDSMSYYECLCGLLDYINTQVMPNLNNVNDGLKELQNLYTELQSYVDNYFSNLDVQDEINNKLDNMAQEGTLLNIIKPYLSIHFTEQDEKIENINQNIEVLSNRMDTFTQLPSGSTSGDAELIDIRNGADGVIYSTAGEAVRKQMENKFSLKTPAVFTITGYINQNGSPVETAGFKRTDYIPVTKDITSIYGNLNQVLGNLSMIAYYDNNQHWISSYLGPEPSGRGEFDFNTSDIPENAKYMIISKRNTNLNSFATIVTNPIEYVDKVIEKEIDYYVGYGTSDNYHFNTLIPCLNRINQVGDKAIVHIKGGSYNIYSDLGGQQFLSSITEQSTSYNIQPWLYNVKLIGEGNVVLVYEPDDTVANTYPLAANLVSVLNVRGNVEIENIEIKCKNCRYGIHDETSGIALYNNTYHNYKNVKIYKGRNATGQTIGGQAFGGGFDNGQTYLFKNCKFETITQEALSFHNRTSNGASFTFENCIFINNAFACVRFGNIGIQGKSIVNLSNCYMKNTNGTVPLLYSNKESSSNSTNAFKFYLNNCNEINVTISGQLGTNLYEPEIYNQI